MQISPALSAQIQNDYRAAPSLNDFKAGDLITFKVYHKLQQMIQPLYEVDTPIGVYVNDNEDVNRCGPPGGDSCGRRGWRSS